MAAHRTPATLRRAGASLMFGCALSIVAAVAPGFAQSSGGSSSSSGSSGSTGATTSGSIGGANPASPGTGGLGSAPGSLAAPPGTALSGPNQPTGPAPMLGAGQPTTTGATAPSAAPPDAGASRQGSTISNNPANVNAGASAAAGASGQPPTAQRGPGVAGTAPGTGDGACADVLANPSNFTNKIIADCKARTGKEAAPRSAEMRSNGINAVDRPSQVQKAREAQDKNAVGSICSGCGVTKR